MPSSSTFVSACLAGTASPGDVDDWVERWHTEGTGELDEFLGLTTEEGLRWAQDPAALESILTDRREAGAAASDSKSVLAHVPADAVTICSSTGLVYCKRCGRLLSSTSRGATAAAGRACQPVAVTFR